MMSPLRHIINGLGGAKGGVPRETQFDITVASEVMAILALTTGLKDIRERLGRIQVALNSKGEPVTAEQLGAAGAMSVLMKDAIQPNLMQRLDGGPAFVHAGPFANIAIGCNSIVADQIALKLGDYVVTEAGFGADIGAEKFMDIKCRAAGLAPNAVVIVATIKALKMHGGGFQQKPGKKPPMAEIMKPNPAAVECGCANLIQHVENMRKFGVPVVVAINAFPYDTPEETEIVRRAAMSAGADAAVESLVHAKGGEGGAALAEAVVAAADKPSELKFLYSLEASIKEKIETIAREIYRAEGVDFSPVAEAKIKQYTKQGYDKLPICMAKTHLSVTHDPDLKNTCPGFTLPVRDIRPSVGAGFLYPLCGEMSTMPALPTRPAAGGCGPGRRGEYRRAVLVRGRAGFQACSAWGGLSSPSSGRAGFQPASVGSPGVSPGLGQGRMLLCPQSNRDVGVDTARPRAMSTRVYRSLTGIRCTLAPARTGMPRERPRGRSAPTLFLPPS